MKSDERRLHTTPCRVPVLLKVEKGVRAPFGYRDPDNDDVPVGTSGLAGRNDVDPHVVSRVIRERIGGEVEHHKHPYGNASRLEEIERATAGVDRPRSIEHRALTVDLLAAAEKQPAGRFTSR